MVVTKVHTASAQYHSSNPAIELVRRRKSQRSWCVLALLIHSHYLLLFDAYFADYLTMQKIIKTTSMPALLSNLISTLLEPRGGLTQNMFGVL